MGYMSAPDDGQVGLSISRVPTPAVGEAELVAVDLGDLAPTTMAAALIEDGQGAGGNRSGRGASVVDEKRASSEVTVMTATDELSSATSCKLCLPGLCGG
jgi:hypothetical protein